MGLIHRTNKGNALKESSGTDTGSLQRIIREQCWKQETAAAAHVGIEQIPVILK
jgi:hypothetical protein